MSGAVTMQERKHSLPSRGCHHFHFQPPASDPWAWSPELLEMTTFPPRLPLSMPAWGPTMPGTVQYRTVAAELIFIDPSVVFKKHLNQKHKASGYCHPLKFQQRYPLPC